MVVRRRSKAPGGKLTSCGKVKKWFRMVILLTFKKYGARILWQLFFAYLLTDAVKAMHSIWTDFADFKNCQDQYIKTISTNVSADYDAAAGALAESIVGRAKCVMGSLDLNLPSPFPDIKLPKSFIGNIFGWFTPGSINIPHAELNIKSNTEEDYFRLTRIGRLRYQLVSRGRMVLDVVESVFKDVNIFKIISVWTRYIGFILAFFSLIMIMFTATYYTITNKVWKPSMKSHIFRFIQFTQAVGAYIVTAVVVFLQAYATNKFCQVSIDKAELKTPKCTVLDKDCKFSCELISKVYPSHCTKCHIKLHWWWIEPFSLPNIFCASYVAFMLIVLIYECCEAAIQRKEILKAKREEREEKRQKRMKYMERKMRDKRAIEEKLLEEETAHKAALVAEDDFDDGYDPPQRRSPESSRRRKKKSKKPSEPVDDCPASPEANGDTIV